MGLAAVIKTTPWLYQTLRWAGAAYLLVLALEAWRGQSEAVTERAPGAPMLRLFQRGLISNLVNPKAAAVFVTVLPRFLPPWEEVRDALQLVAVYAAVATLIHLGIVAAAGTAQVWLKDAPRARFAGRAMALALVGVAGWMLWKT